MIERDILIILRKSSVSVRFISMALNLALLPKTISCTYNDDQTEINFQFKKNHRIGFKIPAIFKKKGLTETFSFLMIFYAQKY